jgi:hypothetical protein
MQPPRTPQSECDGEVKTHLPTRQELFNPLEHIFHIMLDLELLEEVHVFILEGLPGMMLFLIQNVTIHISNLRMTV